MKIMIINGPNLNLLGTREPGIYGSTSFADYFAELQKRYPKDQLAYYQSNIEGDLMDKMQEVDTDYDLIILNAAAYTHTSIALGDTVAGISTPVIEVHISNVMDRETYRHISYISAHAVGVISGFGLRSYQLAIEAGKLL